eukprot:CAMPEP_0178407808 /NCGR_PEP_ID=MMETSP0689_2-20121128/19617_1 /TAXON_ID=160604 /ORGANISM="Amphidinium massartii, Strain CS-259" /LENGTH=82 /DNA_ID=CAMNT_0020028889 /DNA_START=38 /DNA_END=286 /DNA_ORIENTATION=-
MSQSFTTGEDEMQKTWSKVSSVSSVGLCHASNEQLHQHQKEHGDGVDFEVIAEWPSVPRANKVRGTPKGSMILRTGGQLLSL